MLIALSQPESHWEAIQASLRLRRAHVRMNRTVIQAMIRERLELSIENCLPLLREPDTLGEATEQIHSWLNEQLVSLEIQLEQLNLVGLVRCPPEFDASGVAPRYHELWFDNLPCADGFELDLGVVVRGWFPCNTLEFSDETLRALIQKVAYEHTRERDAETALAQIGQFQAALSGPLEAWTDLVRDGVRLLRLSNVANSKVRADRTWITRKTLRASQKAFQPGQRYGYLDPYQLFFMLKDRDTMQRHYGPGQA